jgi:hypothetical protein
MMNYRIRVLLACLLLCTCPSRPLKAQANFPFSLYSFVFQDLCWNGDTSKYIDNEIKDTAALFSVYRSYRFTTPEFYQAYPNIQHAPALSNDIPAIPQNRTLNFSLFGKDGKAQNIFYSGNDTSTCIFVIPGSGINQSTSILNQLWNYHNLNCYIPSFLQNYGDVYLYVKPNEDYRAHWTTQFGPMRKINELGIIQTLMGMGRSYAANYLIECIAMVRYLKSRYNKVLVIGLSQGGSAALYTGLQSEPDAVYVASGYSILFDNAYPASNSNQIYFDSILSYYQSGLVRSSIEAQNSEYLFGWNTNEGVYFSDYEAQTNATKNFFQGVPNIKATTTYFSPGQHTFNCGAMDTFFNYVKSKPKVQLIADSSGCTSDSLILRLHFRGTAPYSFNLYRNGIVLSSHLSPSDTMNIPVYVGGTYEIRDLLDVGNVPGYRSAPLNYVQPPKANLSITGRSFECDSNRTAIQVQLQGTPPFAFTYSMNQNVLSQNTSQSNLTLYAQTDSVHLGTLIDARSCLHQPDTNLVLKDSALQVQLSAPVWDCDSNQVRLDLLLEGKAPWTLFYKVNGLHDSVVLLNTSASVWFGNGVHEMTGIRDANQCWKTLNQFYTFSFQPVSATASIPFYACDSNKTRITFSQQGNAPFTLHYTFDAAPMQMNFNGGSATQDFINGNYHFLALSDATGCVDSLNLSYVFAYDTVDAMFGNPVYDCDSNKTRLPLDLQGNGPWVMNYTLNGVPAQMNFASANNLLYLGNGIYNFLQVQDQTGCVKTLNQVYSFSFQPISATASIPFYACDSNKTRITFSQQGNAPFTLHYTFDAAPMQMNFNGGSATQDFINGNYQFLAISDATGCVDSLNLSHAFAYDTVDAMFGNPVYDCDSNKTRLPLDLQGNGPWVMNYTLNGVPAQMNFASANNLLYLGNGIYNFLQVQDQTGCVKTLNQVYSFSFQPISATASIPFYACDSNKTRITFSQQGNAPFTLHYTFDAAPMQMNFNGGSATQDFINGNYQFLAISDATGCVDSLNLSHAFAYDTVDAMFGNPVYDCDSNKTRLPLDLQGNGPWVMNYTLNGVPAQMNFASANNLLYLGNGIYNFLQVQDQTGCVKTLNQVFTFGFQPVAVQITQQQYDCDSSKYRVQFAFTGNGPWVLSYELQGGFTFTKTFTQATGSIWLSDGQWIVHGVTDQTGCSVMLNLPLTVNLNPINAVISNQVYDCDSNKMRIHFQLQGNSPFQITYQQNPGGSFTTLSTYSSAPVLYLPAGIYQFTTVSDLTGCVKTLNQNISNPYSPLTVQKTGTHFQCDSNKVRIDYQFGGDGPWTIQYRNLGTATNFQKVSAIPSANLFLPTGQYVIQSVSDTKCTVTLADTMQINFPALTATLNTPTILCDSEITHTTLQVSSGLKPFTLHYSLNNQPTSIQTQLNNLQVMMPNGLYYFSHVTDSAGCMRNLGLSHAAQYTPLHATGINSKYLCGLDSAEVSVHFSGTQPSLLLYSKNGGPLDTLSVYPGLAFRKANGSYYFSHLRDASGCVDSLDETKTFDYKPIAFEVDSITPICQERVHTWSMQVNGQAPWTLHYLYKNAPNSLQIPATSFQWKTQPGDYHLQRISDASGCEQLIQRRDTLFDFLSFEPKLETDYRMVSVQASPLWHAWYYEGRKVDSGTVMQIPVRGTGAYWVTLTDSTGCHYTSDTLDLSYPAQVSLYPNPAHDEASLLVQDDFGEYWRYRITDGRGFTIQEDIRTEPYRKLDLSGLSSGIYQVLITYAADGEKHKRVLKLVKH